mmetsp:Transcript_13771/g.26702  ORF Transcript_13771/g.26702 Transcript_13771/m.26702 type:complete len:211 (-) Transcript_13771:2-634(-)
MAKELSGAKRQSIHIFGGCSKDKTIAGHLSALRFSFAGSFNHRDAHQAEEFFNVFVVLFRHLHQHPVQLMLVLRGFRSNSFLQLTFEFLSPFFSFDQFGVHLELRWFTVKDKDRFDTVVHEADGAVEHPTNVAGHFSSFVGQLLVVRTSSHCDQELVQTHTCIDGNLLAKVGLHLFLFDRRRRIVANQFEQTFDSHVFRANLENELYCSN